MQTSRTKQSSIIFLVVIFIAVLLLIFVVYRVTQNSSTIGSPNAAISCAYCDLAYDRNACVLNCNAVNNTNAGADCPTGYTKTSVVRDDKTGFVGCKPDGNQVSCVSGTDCIGLVNPIAGYTVGCTDNKCMMEPIANSRYWSGVLPKDDSKNWADCGCGDAADNTVLHRCDATNPGNTLKFSCSVCGQDAAVVCPLNFVAKVDRVFKGTVTCSDNGVAKPVSNVKLTLQDSKLKLLNATSDSTGSFSFSKTADPETGITYDVNISDTSSASPMPNTISIHALGFDSDTKDGCLPGVNSGLSSKTFCNSICSKTVNGISPLSLERGAVSAGYVSCNAGIGDNLGYNFSIGSCDTVQDVPVYTCYTCDNTVSPKAVVSNTQSSPCMEPSFDTQEKAEGVCK